MNDNLTHEDNMPESARVYSSVNHLRYLYNKLVEAMNDVTAPREVHSLVEELGLWIGGERPYIGRNATDDEAKYGR